MPRATLRRRATETGRQALTISRVCSIWSISAAARYSFVYHQLWRPPASLARKSHSIKNRRLRVKRAMTERRMAIPRFEGGRSITPPRPTIIISPLHRTLQDQRSDEEEPIFHTLLGLQKQQTHPAQSQDQHHGSLDVLPKAVWTWVRWS